MRFIDPRINFAFKTIFGDPNARDILINFLESLLELDDDKKIKTVEELDTYLEPKKNELQCAILFVKCTDRRGISYSVEIQVVKVDALFKPMQCNSSATRVNQIERGDDYPKLNQVIAVTITDFSLFDDFSDYVSCHVTQEIKNGGNRLSGVIYYFIELSKFSKESGDIETALDKWIYFIKCVSDLEDIPANFREGMFVNAFEKAKMGNMSKEELELYDKAGIAIADAKGVIEFAREEGIAAGIKKVREERDIQIAKNLLAEKMDYDLISKATGLEKSAIQKLDDA